MRVFGLVCRWRILQLSGRHFHSTPRVCAGLSGEELQRLHNALKKGTKSAVELHAPTTTTSSSNDRAIVLLVGWAESRLKVLSKLATTLYTSSHHIPCVCLAPPITWMWFHRQGYSITDAILRTLEQSLDDRPTSLIVHLFSGAGSAVFPRLVEEYSTEGSSSNLSSKLTPKGIIFDSGPVAFCRESGHAAAEQIYSMGGMNFVSYSLYNVVGVAVDAMVGDRRREELREAMESRLLDIPQLYLYSRNDKVAPPGWVEEVRERQREKGRETQGFSWDDSEHVQHFREHTQEYTEQVEGFLKHCNVI